MWEASHVMHDGGRTDTVQSGGEAEALGFVLLSSRYRRCYDGLEALRQARVSIQLGKKKSWHDVLIPPGTSGFYKRREMN